MLLDSIATYLGVVVTELEALPSERFLKQLTELKLPSFRLSR